ncbi:hypothetical protein D6C84_06838 [Aureobasidium pullulans]|uniref:Uncharacterized protein n=1 Tax=Aureobasidium pullulans TaxID=5580 RepID=A0A4S9XPP5_AURPU|nr:hypothetical protein D6C84_06838 [Aureobasidium pullulans]
MALIQRDPACILSCLAACFSTTALATFITLFAASVLVPTPIHMHALAAAVFDILAIAILFVFVVFYTCTARNLQSWKWTLATAILLPFTVAMVLSIYVLGWMYNNLPLIKTHGPSEHLGSMVAAALAMWAFSLISIGVYCILYRRQGSSLPDSVIFTSDPLRSYVDVAEHKTHALSLNTLSPYTPNFNRPVSTFSDVSDQSTGIKSSVRNSVQQFLRHGKSTKNTPKQSKESSRSDSTSERRPSDGFETWNVATPTTVEPTSTLSALRTAQSHRLETIPGSRPVSPAYPLDGPFPEASEEDEEADEVPESPAFPPFAPSLNRRPSNQQLNQDQSHIHPLFRSDSPVPSPAASPGTIITSSPFAGQVVSPSDVAFGSRSRKGSALSSRPSSPNPSLVRAASALSLSRPASSRSIRGLAAQQSQRPRVVMSPSLGDLRAEHDKFITKPRPALHKRERSA